MDRLRVFTFAPGWGLPTMGPFALKLLAWLAHHRIDYEQVIENRSDKGPLGNSPWIEMDGLRMGDSDAIIRHLAAEAGLADPTRATSAEAALTLGLKTAFEERFHQILEWELFVHPAGRAAMRAEITSQLPPLVGPLVFALMCRHFRRQLHARGTGRLRQDQIAAEGRAMLDGLALCLQDRGGWLAAEGPGLADFAVWGQVAPMLSWPMRTPVADHAKTLPALADWHERMQKGMQRVPVSPPAARRPTKVTEATADLRPAAR
jgi:hypothetical protein